MQDFNARLSDFGLARDGPTGDNTHVSTRVVGTRGYAAPEYVATGQCYFSTASIIFSPIILEKREPANKIELQKELKTPSTT